MTKVYRHFLIVNDVPRRFHNDTVYLVAQESRILFAVFLCPCGCYDIVHLPTYEDFRPYWIVTISQNTSITLWPAIVKTSGCKISFELKDSKAVSL